MRLAALGDREAGKWLDLDRMNLSKTLAVINEMHVAGVIGRCGIAGAIGATFYLEPVATVDVDVFVAIHPEPGQLIATPKPI